MLLTAPPILAARKIGMIMGIRTQPNATPIAIPISSRPHDQLTARSAIWLAFASTPPNSHPKSTPASTPVRSQEPSPGGVGSKTVNSSPKSTPIALCAPALVRVSGSRDVLALYDHERRELVLAGGSGFRDQVVGFVDERAVIVLEDRKRIARIHFGSDERELLFPR